MTNINQNTTLNRATDLFCLAIIGIICLKLTHALSTHMDILFYDESLYLQHGRNFNISHLFKDGFIYLLWYKLLSLITPDPINLYYLNYTLLLLLNPTLIYILLRKLNTTPLISLISALVFLISNANIIAWPFITRFALTLILTLLLTTTTIKKNKTKYITILTGLTLLTYTRPEYILSFSIFIITFIIFFITSASPHMISKNFRKFDKFQFFEDRRALVLTLIITVTAGFFVTVIQNPARSKRSVMAFGQHYAVHLYQKGKTQKDPNTHWKQIMTDHFGTHDSLARAFFNNPAAMISHGINNIKELPYQTMQHFSPHNTPITPLKKILFVLITLLTTVIVTKNIIRKPHQTNQKILLGLILLIALPLILSICIIYPREHYLLVLFGLIILILGQHISPFPKNKKENEKEKNKHFKWMVYPVAIVIALFFPWRADGTEKIHKQCTNIKKINLVRAAKQQELNNRPVVFLGYGGSMAAYIDDYKHVYEHTKNQPFNQWLKNEKINMILVNNALKKDTRFKNDPQFNTFLNSIPANWSKIKIPHCDGFLLIKK